MNTSSKDDTADAIVVGSGATGGWAAKVLSEGGLEVLVLEAGPPVPPDHWYIEPFRMVRRLINYANGARRMQSFHPAYWASNPDFFIDDRTGPLTTPPGRPFHWIRSRQVGGRTLLWGGVTLRMSDHELKSFSRGGFGVDWPIGYADLAPWYDKVEQGIGIYGKADALPQLPDGVYLGSRPLTAAEERLRQGVESTWPDRRVIVSRGIDGSLPPVNGETWNRLTSCGSSLADAVKTGQDKDPPQQHGQSRSSRQRRRAGRHRAGRRRGLRRPPDRRETRSPRKARRALRIHDLECHGPPALGGRVARGRHSDTFRLSATTSWTTFARARSFP